MNLRQYALIGLVPSILGCAGPVNLLRENKIPYTITCDYPDPDVLTISSAYNIDLSVRHICLESESGERFTLKFREGSLRGKARGLVDDISDKVEGQKVLLSLRDILDAQNNLDDGCTVATISRRKNVERH